MNRGVSYKLFYDILLELREEFHRNGRLDDSNAKLDEIVKLLVMSIYESKKGTHRFNLEHLRQRAKSEFGDSTRIASALNSLFQEIVKDPMFFNQDQTNIFGFQPSLSLQPSENEFAEKLVSEISKLDFSLLDVGGNIPEFDIINESFGHFVRDNFRNNKEDAQYMTPQEIVHPVLDMVFNDIFNEEDFEARLFDEQNPFIIMDPTCGVGTLLVEPLRYIIRYVDSLDIDDEQKEHLVARLKKECIVGQDKVDRMVRLTKLNLMLLGVDHSKIFCGNSILNSSSLDDYIGRVDFIFTNPPFGATFSVSELKNSKRYSIIPSLDGGNIDSELILLDRCLTLLKPNGRLLIVLPDSVVSAKGIYSTFRDHLLNTCEIKAVIDLPSVTFAQAGTRTKSVILYLKKRPAIHTNIFMGICDDVGYDVKERQGVPVKFESGVNQMPMIADSYVASRHSDISSHYKIISEMPSATLVDSTSLIGNYLTPSFYRADRLKSLIRLQQIDSKVFELRELKELATFASKKRKSHHVTDKIKHISVLHVNGDGTINLDEVLKFKPVTKGNECYPGDVLFSRINPRIPRLAVVPKVDVELVCSNEFEILVPKQGVDPYLLYMLLRLDVVSNQIQYLVSGTSSSHNRIKSEQLQNVLIPWPKSGTAESKLFNEVARETERAISQKYLADRSLASQSQSLVKALFK